MYVLFVYVQKLHFCQVPSCHQIYTGFCFSAIRRLHTSYVIRLLRAAIHNMPQMLHTLGWRPTLQTLSLGENTTVSSPKLYTVFGPRNILFCVGMQVLGIWAVCICCRGAIFLDDSGFWNDVTHYLNINYDHSSRNAEVLCIFKHRDAGIRSAHTHCIMFS